MANDHPAEPTMAMLPNDHHPGPGCSCGECLRAHPDPQDSTPAQQQVVVPREPTVAMLRTFAECWKAYAGSWMGYGRIEASYKAMLSAAPPAAPASSENVDGDLAVASSDQLTDTAVVARIVPATPLPWTLEACAVDLINSGLGGMKIQDAHYINHAANAYPKLVEALSGVLHHYATQPGAFGIAAHSTEITAADLLRSLGELGTTPAEPREGEGSGQQSNKQSASALAAPASSAPASSALQNVLEEILNYSGGAENALADPYVVERAHAALAQASAQLADEAHFERLYTICEGEKQRLWADLSQALAAPSTRDAEDARRWRKLLDTPATITFDEAVTFRTPNGGQVINVKMIGNTELDAAIDAALEASQSGGER